VDTDDRELVARAQAGDLAAFEPLVEKYRQRVWRLARNVVRDREEARDVAQEAFIRAFQALPSFRGQSAFYTWLFRITMNVAADRVRARAARGRAFGTEPVPEEEWDRLMVEQGDSPATSAGRAEERARITRAVDTLPEHHRTIIMLGDVEGLSYREIADVLHIPMGTVMSRLHNARRKLRDALGPLLLVALLLLSAVLASPGAAQPLVRFGARVLLATDGPPPPGITVVPAGPDERLQAFMPKLRKLFQYAEYTSIERYRAEVPLGATQRWPVPGDRVLELTPEDASRSVRLRLRLLRGSIVELSADIQAAPGQPAVLGGPRHGDGTLIIIVWANPEPR
jgi:RNA polymerase sigma-70 factor (ECF subfamily)